MWSYVWIHMHIDVLSLFHIVPEATTAKLQLGAGHHLVSGSAARTRLKIFKKSWIFMFQSNMDSDTTGCYPLSGPAFYSWLGSEYEKTKMRIRNAFYGIFVSTYLIMRNWYNWRRAVSSATSISMSLGWICWLHWGHLRLARPSWISILNQKFNHPSLILLFKQNRHT